MSHLFFSLKNGSSWQPPCDNDRHVPPWVYPCLALFSHRRRWLFAGCLTVLPERWDRPFCLPFVLHWSCWDPAVSSVVTQESHFWISAPRCLSWAIQFPPVDEKYVMTLTPRSVPPALFFVCVIVNELCVFCLFSQFQLSLQEVSNCSGRLCWFFNISPHQWTGAIRKNVFMEMMFYTKKNKKKTQFYWLFLRQSMQSNDNIATQNSCNGHLYHCFCDNMELNWYRNKCDVSPTNPHLILP